MARALKTPKTMLKTDMAMMAMKQAMAKYLAALTAIFLLCEPSCWLEWAARSFRVLRGLCVLQASQ